MKISMQKMLFLFLFVFVFSIVVANAQEKVDNSQSLLENTALNENEKKILDVFMNADYTEFVSLLDEGVIDPNAVVGGRTLAVLAVNYNFPKKLTKLLDMGADPNITDSRGRTPLVLAARRIRPELVEIILSRKGVDTYYKDADSKSALDYIKGFDEKAIRDVRKNNKRTESIKQLQEEIKNISTAIIDYQRNSVLAVDSSYVMGYLPQKWVDVLQFEILGIPLWRYIAAVLFLVITIIINKILALYLYKIAQKYKTDDVNDKRSFVYYFIIALRSSIKFLIKWFAIYFFIAMIAPSVLNAAAWAFDVILTITMAIFFYNLSAIIETVLILWLDKSAIRLSEALSNLIRKSIRVVIIIWAILHIYSLVTSSSITTLIAGLGIGGMAVALAATDTLKNFLGFITIITDRPFAIGDRVEIKGCDGVVEHIGMRTTRIRRLDGHQVSIPNASTVSDAVRNIARRPFLKKDVSITITYDTPLGKVEKAIEIVKDILKDHEGMSEDRPPRVYFVNMNADNLEIIATYWYFPADWYAFCEFNEKFNLELMKRYEAEGIEFAFPTQTVYLADDPNRRIVVQNTDYKDI